jgi:hypothetical protein
VVRQPAERVNKEIKGRHAWSGIFRNDAAVIRLVGAAPTDMRSVFRASPDSPRRPLNCGQVPCQPVKKLGGGNKEGSAHFGAAARGWMHL